METTKVLGKDAAGRTIAEYTGIGVNGTYSFRYYQTPCCGADATGVSITAFNPAGVACRACYAPLPEVYGGLPAELAEEAEPTGYICKQCEGPAPMGIGYAAAGTAAAAASAALTQCGCGYSTKEAK